MARPERTLTPDQVAEVETLAALLNAEQIADYFGIGRTTFFAMVKRDQAIAERYKRGRARAIGAIAQSLITKARAGDTACMIFYLKTQGGWREHAPMDPPAAFEPDPEVRSGAEKITRFLEQIAERQRAALEPPVAVGNP